MSSPGAYPPPPAPKGLFSGNNTGAAAILAKKRAEHEAQKKREEQEALDAENKRKQEELDAENKRKQEELDAENKRKQEELDAENKRKQEELDAENKRKQEEEEQQKLKLIEDELTAEFASIDAPFDEEFAVPHEGKLREGIEYVKKMPKHLAFREPKYDVHMHHVTEDYRGADFPMWATHIVKKAPVMLSFVENDNDPELVKFQEYQFPWRSYGTMLGNSKDDFIRMKTHLDTQYPSIELFIKRNDKQTLSYRVFANSFRTLDDGVAHIEVHSGQNLDAGYCDNTNLELADGYNKTTMSQIVLHLNQRGVSNNNPRLEGRRPIWTGDLTDQELLDIIAGYEKARSDGTLADFPKPDAVIAKLHKDSYITISRQQLPKYVDQFERSMNFFVGCLNMCVTYGNLWFYTRHLNANQSILNLREIWIEAPIPRWLVKEWAIERNDKGDIIAAVPSKWSQFKHPGVMPDLTTAATSHVLGLARGVDTITSTIQARLDKESGSITAHFEPFFGDTSKYSVQVVCNLQDSLLSGQSLVPEAGTAIQIEFRDGDNNLWKFNGSVVPTFNRVSEITFSAIVSPAGKQTYQFKSDMETLMVSIKLLQDNKSIGREYVALKVAAQGITREKGEGGPDMPRILMDAPPQDPEIPTNPWGLSITPEEHAQFMQTIKDVHHANAGQCQVAELVLTDVNGVCVVIAPPGTGKTKTGGDLITTIFELQKNRKTKHPMLICAPANLAVDEILKRMIQVDPTLGGMNAIRFRGGRTKEPEKTDEKESDTARQTRQLSDDWWDAMEYMASSDALATEFGDREYHVNFAKSVVTWSQTQTHPMCRHAREFTNIQAQLMLATDMTSATRVELKERVKTLEGILQTTYFEAIDAIFVTFNTAFHEILVEKFKPRCLLGDETAMATLPNMLTAVVPYWASLHHAIFIGDPNQQRGRAMAPSRNEFGKIQTTSFMARVQEEKGKYIKFVQLTEQYRMHEQISGPVNKIFYNGTMTDHSSTKAVQPVRTTAVDFFNKTFGKAYKGWYRFGVASDHSEQNSSKTFMETTSMVNAGEAETILAMVAGLLAHDAPEGGVKVQPSDIMLTTPYTGHAVHLWMRSKQLGIFGEDHNCIRIRTGAASQGQEGNIQFISFCTNTDKGGLDKLKFVAERHGLNVLMSRAKYMQICVGNFLDWMRVVKKDEDDLFKHKKSGLYHFGQIVSSFWEGDNADDCTIVDSKDADNALFRDTPATKSNSFPTRISYAPKRKTPAGGQTEFQLGRYGAQPEGRSKKGKRAKAAPRNKTPAQLSSGMKPLTADQQKLLDARLVRWKAMLALNKEYMLKERADIDSLEEISAIKVLFKAHLQQIYLEKVEASLTQGMKTLNTHPMSMEQCLTECARLRDDTEGRTAFLDSLPPTLRQEVIDHRAEATKKKLQAAQDAIMEDNDDDAPWGEDDMDTAT